MTGAARGIGLAIARCLAEEGAHSVSADINGAGAYQLLQGHILPPALTLLFYPTSASQLAQGQRQEPVG
jgi:NAD(P)-dependent dehydrogenase (short-subunit alcohol dehydrogenase family)